MRRLARWLFTLCSAVSLLLCVAVCVLWVRSYFVGDTMGWVGTPSVGVASGDGLLWIGWAPSDGGRRPQWVHYVWEADGADFYLDTSPERRTLGFAYAVQPEPGGGTRRQVIVPWAALATPSAALPMWWSVRWFRRRPRGGLCACGYDLASERLFAAASAVSLVLWAVLALAWARHHIPAGDVEERRLARVMWVPFAATVTLPLGWALSRRHRVRRHRIAHGLCPS